MDQQNAQLLQKGANEPSGNPGVDSPKPEAGDREVDVKDCMAVAPKPRLHCLDGLRFLLILPIILGHFVRFGTDNKNVQKLLTQENVVIGGLFVLSGYLSAYQTTIMGDYGIDKRKLQTPELYFWTHLMKYYPLHFVVSTVFAPMFIYVDRVFKSPWRFHALLNYTMMQAWFPASAKLWNPPTWIYSAFTFSNTIMSAAALPHLANLSKDGLGKMLVGLNGISMLQKVSYSQAWKFSYEEGNAPQLWNTTRFHPFWALMEVMMGACAARDAMLDDKEAPQSKPATNPAWLFAAMCAPLTLRLTSVNFNDAMVRSFWFIPVFTKFVAALHRDSVSERPSMLTRFLGSRVMAYLGTVAFPMYMLHGPIGQLCYKKTVAQRVWGRVMPKEFFVKYLLIVLVSGIAVNEGFIKNRLVKRLTAWIVRVMTQRTEGMLQDKEKSS